MKLHEGQCGTEIGNLIQLNARFQEGQKNINYNKCKNYQKSFLKLLIVMNKNSWKVENRIAARYFHLRYS